MSGRKVILPVFFNGSPRHLHKKCYNAIAIAKDYHKPDLFINLTCNLQWPEITHSLHPNQQPQDRPNSKFHFLSKLYDKSAMLVEPIHNMIDIGTLHLLHQHHLLLVLMVPKMPNLHTLCLCSMVFLLKFSTNFDKNTNEI